MNRRNRNRNTAGKGSGIIPAILAVIFFLNAMAGSVDGSFVVLLVAICFIAGIVAVIAIVAKKAVNPGMLQGMSGKREKDRAEDKAMFSSASRAPVVYNERSAEELFLRDKQKRLEQLEVFLKNGIVDKAEYNLLKKRYENYSYERN